MLSQNEITGKMDVSAATAAVALPGETVGIIGSAGSGKSSLVRFIPHLGELIKKTSG